MPSKIKPSAVRMSPELKADLAKIAVIDGTSEHSVYVRGLQAYAIQRLGLDPALAYVVTEKPKRQPKAAKPEAEAPNAAAPKPDRRAAFSEAVAPAFKAHPKPSAGKKVKAK